MCSGASQNPACRGPGAAGVQGLCPEWVPRGSHSPGWAEGQASRAGSPPSSAIPWRKQPVAPGLSSEALCLATAHTRKRKVESHQVRPEPHFNVVHDRGLRNGDLWRRQAAGQAAPQPGEGRQNTEQRKSSKATPKRNQNVHRAKKRVGTAGAGNTRQPHMKWQVREAMRWPVLSSRADRQVPGGGGGGGVGDGRAVVRVLEMVTF